MTVSAKYYCAVKDGSPPEHNDDAAAADESRGRFAVSDGAAESGFSRVWSKLLVDQFVAHAEGTADDWKSWLPGAQQRWLDELKGVDIPWYGEQQFEQGSFATFLGLLLLDSNERRRRWHAVAVGDSCLFHTRDGELQACFPLEQSSQFSFTPKLVGSRSAIDEVMDKRSLSARGIAEPGDSLWLMSDALAKWCLAQDEAGRPPWQELTSQFMADCSSETFSAWLDQLRASRGLFNDDVTLMLIQL
jgi:hypothetical protein